MTISVLQDRQTSSSASVSSVALAFSSSVTAGSAAHGIGANFDSDPRTITFSDNNNNAWPAGTLDLKDDTVGQIRSFHQVTQNFNSGACTVTITFSAPNTAFTAIWIREIGGAATTGNPDGHNGVFSSSTTSQTITATNASQPALVSVVCVNSSSLQNPTLDASLTASSANPGWGWSGPAGTVAGHKRVTSTGTQSITNTQPSDSLVSLMAIFVEAGAGAGTTTTAWQPIRPMNPPGALPGKLGRFYQSPKSYAVATNVTAALTGQAATFAAGTATPGTSVTATGQAATFTAGTVIPATSLAVTGKAATFAAGTVTPSNSISLTGQAATFAAGLLTPSTSLALTGQAGTFAAGTLTPSTAVLLTGQVATFGAGTMSTGSDVTVSLTGQAATFTAGILAPNTTLALSGGAASFAAGNLLATSTLGLTGQGGTFASGTLSPSSAIALTGLQASFSAGLLGVVGDVTVALSGQSATFTAGLLTVPAALTNDAGRRIRNIYRVTIDGQVFEFRTLQEALKLLDQAKELAAKVAEDDVIWQQPLKRPKAPPVITVSSRELRKAAAETKREIQATYEKAALHAELRMLLELSRRQEEDDTLLLLM